ncbi:MAG TPA: ATP-binding protein [Acidobacteriota bacterium]|nr:ATP-binding protein [Acidobacteriota bacterium]
MKNRLTESPRPEPSIVKQGGLDLYAGRRGLLLNLIKQLLVTRTLEERLFLALETLTTALDYRRAAIALIDGNNISLNMRMAVGFQDDTAIESIQIPLDSRDSSVGILHDGQPGWIERGLDQAPESAVRPLLQGIDLLVLPLFGEQSSSEISQKSIARRPSAEGKYWEPKAICLGALFVCAERSKTETEAVNLLEQFADILGSIIAATRHSDQLAASVKQLEAERQWVESIMNSVADPIVLTNLDNEILLQNFTAEELFSGSEDASEGKRHALKMNDLLFSAYLSSAGVSSTKTLGRDLTLVDPLEGSDIHFEVISSPALNAAGERIGLVSVFRNVTDLRRANEELARNVSKLQQAEAEARRERDRLDLIIENVGQPVAVCDPQGNFILCNRRAELLFEEQVPSSRQALAAVRANSVKLTSFISGLASDSRTARKAEIEMIDPATGKALPMEIASVEVYDTKGQVTAVVSVLHDLSEIRELERRRVERQLFESEKLAAIGRLAASVAHEVNNPLEAIKNSLYLLKDPKNTESNATFLNIALKETERVSHIVLQMLGFARSSGTVEWIDINAMLVETLVLVEKKLQKSNITLVRELSADLPKVRARPEQLRQVFLNLILNAQQAIEHRGKITVRTAPYKISVERSVLIEIADTGCGIGEEELGRIFEPFFSRKKGGTGLGLWVTHDIVTRHGGRLFVKSAENRGTTFQVILPVSSPVLEKAQSDTSASSTVKV